MKKNFPRIYHAFLLMMLGWSLSGALFALLYFIYPELFDQGFGLLVLLNAVPLTVMILVSYRIRGGLWGEVFPLRVPKTGDLFFLLLAAAGLSILLSEADNLFRLVFPVPEEILRAFAGIVAKGNLLPLLFFVSVMVPLLEEFFFRGIVLQGFLENYSPRRALLVSALYFALFHLNPWQFIGAFAGGLVMGWIFYRTGNLGHAVILHGIFNALPTLKVNLGISLPGYINMEAGVVFQPLWLDAAGVLFLAAGLLYFYRRK